MTTQVFFHTETGLFSGNTLNATVRRNISPDVVFSVSTAYSFLDSTEFDHNSGNMYRFYRNLGFSEKHLSDTGTNPYSQAHQTTLGLTNIQDNAQLRVTYGDFQHDLRPMHPVVDNDTTYWVRNRDYYTSISAKRPLFTSHGSLVVSGRAEINRNRQNLTTPAIQIRNAGEKTYVGGKASYEFLQTGGHHLLLTATGEYEQTEDYGKHTDSHKRTALILGDSISTENMKLVVHGGLAYTTNDNNDKDFFPLVRSHVSHTRDPLHLSAWLRADSYRGIHPFATTNHELLPERSSTPYPITSGGITGELLFDNIQLRSSYAAAQEIPEEEIPYYFPGNTGPSKLPTQSIGVGTTLQPSSQIALIHDTHLRNARPFWTSRNAMRILISPQEAERTVSLDLHSIYYSARGKTEYILDTRQVDEVLDIGAKVAAEIKTFRFYLRADNLLNRAHAYAPGYTMPGVTFRWGFSWNIRG